MKPDTTIRLLEPPVVFNLDHIRDALKEGVDNTEFLTIKRMVQLLNSIPETMHNVVPLETLQGTAAVVGRRTIDCHEALTRIARAMRGRAVAWESDYLGTMYESICAEMTEEDRRVSPPYREQTAEEMERSFDTIMAGPKVAQRRADWRATHTTERKDAMEARFKIGEPVTLNFFKAGTVEACTIFAVRFTDDKVRYDVLVNTGEGQTLIENVDSAMVR